MSGLPPIARPKPIDPPAGRVRGTFGPRAQRPAPGDSPRLPPALRPLSLKANISWVLLGNGVHALSRWALVVVLARLGNAEMVGLVVLAFALTAPVAAMANLGLRNVLITDPAAAGRFGDYLGLRMITAAASVVVVGVVVVASAYRGAVAWVILVVAVGKALECLIDIFHGLLQQRERMDRASVGLIIQGLLTLTFLAAGIWVTGHVIWGVLGFPLALILVLLVWDLPNGLRVLRGSGREVEQGLGQEPASHWGARPLACLLPGSSAGPAGPGLGGRGQQMLRLAWISLPMGVATVLMSLSANIPKYVIQWGLGSRDLGIYAAIVYPTMLAALVMTAMGQSARPRLARYHREGNRARYFRLLLRMAAVAIGLGGAGIVVMGLAGEPILRLVYGGPFAAYADLAVWVTAAAAVRYLTRVFAGGLDATRHFKLGMLIRGGEVLLLLAAVPGLVARWGLYGVPAGIVLGSLATLAAYAVALWAIVQPGGGGPSDVECPALRR